VPVIVPIGDLQDMADISEGGALNQEWRNLETMRARYGAGETLLLLAAPVWDGQQISALNVNIYTAVSGRPQFATAVEVTKHGGESDKALFGRAVSDIQHKLRKLWKDMTVVEPGQMNEITARVRIQGMQDWLAVKAALDAVKILDEISILSLTPREAIMALRFRGDESRLRLALSQRNLSLSIPRQAAYPGRQGAYDPYRRADTRAAVPVMYDLTLGRAAPQSYDSGTSRGQRLPQ
jgi:hypothetical protein